MKTTVQGKQATIYAAPLGFPETRDGVLCCDAVVNFNGAELLFEYCDIENSEEVGKQIQYGIVNPLHAPGMDGETVEAIAIKAWELVRESL